MSNKFDKKYYKPKKIDEKLVGELFNIIESVDIDLLTKFSLQKKIPLSVRDNKGNNLIHHVISKSDKAINEIKKLNIIKYLINNNVNPNAPNEENQTPLHLACKKQKKRLIEYLIDVGVNVNHIDNYGNTCLHYLTAGLIGTWKDKSKKPLIKKPKKNVSKKYKALSILKKKVWDEVKDSQFLKLINNTLEASIGNSNTSMEIVENFDEYGLYYFVSGIVYFLELLNIFLSSFLKGSIFKFGDRDTGLIVIS